MGATEAGFQVPSISASLQNADWKGAGAVQLDHSVGCVKWRSKQQESRPVLASCRASLVMKAESGDTQSMPGVMEISGTLKQRCLDRVCRLTPWSRGGSAVSNIQGYVFQECSRQTARYC